MLKKLIRTCLVGGLATTAVLLPATVASAHTGQYARFNYCPSTNPEVSHCLNSGTYGGKIILGKKTTPIVNEVILQGGYSEANETTHLAKFYEATNGITLSKTAQPVPGGLAGLVNCKEISNIILRVLCEATFENGLTGVNATLELAKPASQIEISEYNLLVEEGLALQLPVKVHLENPLLGSSCYVGSSSHPLIWNLTTGETSPPAGFTPLHGTSGQLEGLEEDRIVALFGNELVDNTWTAPGATGCGEPFSLILDPILDLALGVPSSAGENSATLKNNVYAASSIAVNKH